MRIGLWPRPLWLWSSGMIHSTVWYSMELCLFTISCFTPSYSTNSWLLSVGSFGCSCLPLLQKHRTELVLGPTSWFPHAVYNSKWFMSRSVLLFLLVKCRTCTLLLLQLFLGAAFLGSKMGVKLILLVFLLITGNLDMWTLGSGLLLLGQKEKLSELAPRTKLIVWLFEVTILPAF